ASKRTWERAVCNDQKPDGRGRPASSERVRGHPKYFYGPVRSMYPRLERAPAPTPGLSSTSTPSTSYAHPLPLPSALQTTFEPFCSHPALRALRHHAVCKRGLRFHIFFGRDCDSLCDGDAFSRRFCYA